MLTTLQTLELHSLIVAGFTFRLLLRDGMLPSSRMAWFMVILTVPVAGAMLYFLFGEVDLGHHQMKRHRQIVTRLRQGAPPGIYRRADMAGRPAAQMRAAFLYAASVNGFAPVAGNRAELMADEHSARDRLIADIDAARQSVHILYYIWLEDETGARTAQALVRAARRGVKCRVMVDAVGSRAFTRSALWHQMGAAGVELARALPIDRLLRVLLTSRIDLRNHRKITVIDGRVAHLGSQNCADPEFRIKAKYAPWVDLMVRVEGPVVAQKQLLFASDWLKEVETPLEEFALEPPAHPGGFEAVAMGDGPTERPRAGPQMFVTLIDAALEELTITTPYFVPDPTVIEALCAAALRGVKVSLIVPEANDSWVVAAASRSYYRKLLEAGATIWEYRGGLLHAKSLSVDRQAVFFGSSNLDMRSFDLNYENDLLVEDPALTAAICARQRAYMASARQVTLDEIACWSRPRRMWQNALATIGPVL